MESTNYYEIYSPIVNWFNLQLLLVHALILRLHTRLIDFVMAYPQDPIEQPLFMKFPRGIRSGKGLRKTHIIKLTKNLYEQKQVRKVCVKHLSQKLNKIGFT